MKVRDLVYETAMALDANRARSLLTILGVVIGIAAVISMTGMIGGVKASLYESFGMSQTRRVNIYCFYEKEMVLRDVEVMQEELEDWYEYITPAAFGGATIASDTKSVNGNIRGTYEVYASLNEYKFAQGRYFNEDEIEDGALVAVLDQPSVKTLFGSENEQVVDRTVRIGSADFTIVGVIESSEMSGSGDSASAYVPFTTCAQRVTGNNNVTQTTGMALEGVDVDKAAEAARTWLIEHFNIPESERESAVYVTTMKSIADQLNSLIGSFQLLMTAVASISLLVGGIGIMNMMLTNVTERIREIGLRKALGAQRRDITRQFLLESICLTLAGGAIGIALGYVGAYGVIALAGGFISEMGGTDIKPVIDLQSVLIAAGICVLTGVVFGYYPARRAARLDPVEALHYQ